MPERQNGSVRDRWRSVGRLLRLLWELSPRAMAINAGVTLVIGLAPLLPLVALRHLVDTAARVTMGASLAQALGWTIALVAARCLQSGASAAAYFVRDRVQEQLRTEIQGLVIARAQALPLAAFEQPELHDQLQRIERGLGQRLLNTMGALFSLGNLALTLAALLLYVGAAHAALPVILIAGTLPSLLLRVRIQRERYLMERKQTERHRRLRYLGELMTGREAAGEIRLFGLRDTLLSAWSGLHRELRDERLALARREFRVDGAGYSGQALTLGLALAVVVSLIAGGRLTVGQYAAFAGAVEGFQGSMLGFLENLALLDSDLRYIRDFFLYLDLPEEAAARSTADRRPLAADAGLPAARASGPGRRMPPGVNELVGDGASAAVGGPRSVVVPGIRFENVGFTYPGSERPALRAINLHLRPGERIALVGENGAGKTTLARLLLGLYRPSEGRIVVDGVDLGDIDPAAWRRRVAVVFQEFQQYHLTVRENIGFGDLERLHDLPAIERAGWLSGADAVVATMPTGYETPLGKAYEEGVELSLGQWQKLAVARAYLREAELLVLDEPTAALDARAEVEVYRQFRDVSRGKTVLLISHRLGSARLADRILVLEAGMIVEEGSHAELMARGGLYSRMLGAQAQWYA
jgi:ATP-binding cassette, subfamily B, bacterial